MKKLIKNLIISATCIFMGVLLLIWLYFDLTGFLSGRAEYHTLIPFYIGFALSVIVMLWPIYKIKNIFKKSLVIAIISTLFLSPIPFGPEGTFLPLAFTILFLIVSFHFQFYLIFPAMFLFSYAILLAYRTLCAKNIKTIEPENSLDSLQSPSDL